jgi:hypothetical protein
MANKDMVVGFVPHGKIESLREYTAGSNPIYPGDLVRMNASGLIDPCAASDSAIGVAMNYCAASGKVLVCDGIDQKFMVQADDATIDAQTDIGLNYDIVVAAANTTYKRSGMELDASTQATTNTLPLRLLAVDKQIDNALGANVKCIVKINNHQLGNASVGL